MDPFQGSFLCLNRGTTHKLTGEHCRKTAQQPGETTTKPEAGNPIHVSTGSEEVENALFLHSRPSVFPSQELLSALATTEIKTCVPHFPRPYDDGFGFISLKKLEPNSRTTGVRNQPLHFLLGCETVGHRYPAIRSAAR